MRRGRQWELLDGELRAPDVEAAMRRTLQQLSPQELQVLRTVAVLGEPVPFARLQACCRLEESLLLDAVDHLLALKAVIEQGSSGVEIAASLSRPVLDGLSQPRRQQLHRRIAEALLQTEPAATWAIGRHLHAAGAPEEALPHYRAACEKAIGVPAFQRAADIARSMYPIVQLCGSMVDRYVVLDAWLLPGDRGEQAERMALEWLDSAADATARGFLLSRLGWRAPPGGLRPLQQNWRRLPR
ncbi:MAG: hypothetical protein ACYCW6_13775 [Candidatus Xenobia bacterium]